MITKKEYLEILVVDDCSEKSGQLITNQYGYINYLSKANKSNVANSRNLGIAHSNAKYILFLDDDDYLLNNAIDEILQGINCFSNFNFHFYNYLIKDLYGEHEKRLSNIILNSLLIVNSIPIGGFIIKKESIKKNFDEKLKTHEDWNFILDNLKTVTNIIVDESFIHFAYEDIEFNQISSQELISKYKNLIIIKSMSKDFGIAGLRAGYSVMDADKVNLLLQNGYLWNISGLTNYFFNVYANKDFISKYNIVRKKYIINTLNFLTELKKINGIKVYPSKANFALIEILNGKTSFDFTMDLLMNYGIYVRDCSDKIGLDGQFVRIASRSSEENLKVIEALKIIA